MKKFLFIVLMILAGIGYFAHYYGIDYMVYNIFKPVSLEEIDAAIDKISANSDNPKVRDEIMEKMAKRGVLLKCANR